jgi:hypothetical protein
VLRKQHSVARSRALGPSAPVAGAVGCTASEAVEAVEIAAAVAQLVPRKAAPWLPLKVALALLRQGSGRAWILEMGLHPRCRQVAWLRVLLPLEGQLMILACPCES